MKKITYSLLLLTLFITTVNAQIIAEEDIPDESIVIGTHLFTRDISEGDSPNYKGNITTLWAMTAATTLTSGDYENMLIAYKWSDGDWTDFYTDEDIECQEEYEINYRNGICIDPSCSGETYKVTFAKTDYNDEKATDYAYYSTISESSAPILKERVGFKFKYWTKENANEEYDFSTPITEDVTLIPSWEQIEYKITYHTNTGEDRTKEEICKYDENNNMVGANCSIKDYIDVLSEYNNMGHEFKGWATSPKGEKIYTSESDIKELLRSGEKIELYAIWDTHTYRLNYNDQHVTCNYGEVCTLKDFKADEKIGYDFISWYVTDDGKDIGLQETVVDLTSDNKEYELKAKYIPHEYSITYILNEAPEVNGNPTSINVKDEEITLISPTRKGYTFNGWELISDSNGATLNGNKLKLNGEDPSNVVINTKWKANEVRISFKLEEDVSEGGTRATNYIDAKDEDGNIIEDIVCQYDKAEECKITKAAKIEIKGKEFDGWQYAGIVYKVGAEVNTSNLYNEESKEIIMVPKLTSTQKNIIEYDLNGGHFITSEEGNKKDYVNYYLDGENEVTIPIPERKGYKFAGWRLGDSDLEDNTKLPVSQGDVKLTAKWNPIEYQIEFKDGNTTIETLICKYDEICEFGDHSEYFGERAYRFLGWGYNTDQTVFYGDKIEVMNVEDSYQEDGDRKVITLQAVILSPYDISFNLDGGSMVEREPSYYLETIDLSKYEPTKEEYDFKGWIITEDGEPVDGIYKITDNVTFTAKWERNTFEVTMNNEDISSNIIKVKKGEEFDPSEYIPEDREYFEFQGWEKEGTPGIITNPIVITNDVVLVAKWKQIEYTVTFQDSEGTIDNIEKFPAGEKVTEDLIPDTIDTSAIWIINDEEVNLIDYFNTYKIEGNITFTKKVIIVEPEPEPTPGEDEESPETT